MQENSLLKDFIADHQLPASFSTLAQHFYLPLADWISERRSQETLLIGINGCQGSGKSTLADFVARTLHAKHDWNIAVLSIDDLYLTHQERSELAARIHPLLQTRGVPGTHDIELGLSVLNRLCSQSTGESTALPRFDKSCDDRAPSSQWPSITGKVDMIILEGWCVGSKPQPDSALAEPANTLEADEDPQGEWRTYVNRCLADYQKLFDRLHALILLRAPDFSCVYQWRLEQEHKLAARAPTGSKVMNDAEVARFIQHYQRLTEVNLAQLPDHADVILELNTEHGIDAARYR